MKYNEIADLEINETTRQAQKTLQNHIGDFHQNILGSVDGWINLKVGSIIDLISEDLPAIIGHLPLLIKIKVHGAR